MFEGIDRDHHKPQNYWDRGYITSSDISGVMKESLELVAIFTKSIQTTKAKKLSACILNFSQMVCSDY